MAMVIVGAILTEVDWRTVLDGGLFYLAFVRLIFLPVFLLFIMQLFGVPQELRGVCVIMTAMPVGTTTAILAAKYGADDQYGSKAIFITTVLSLITVPVLTMFI
jgi:predicted permease